MVVKKKDSLTTHYTNIPKKSIKHKNAYNQKSNLISCLILLLIVIYTAVLYSKSINNGYNWDDKKYLLTNNYILNFSWNGIKDLFKISSSILGTYQPVTNLSWLIECKLWGLSPGVFHLDNLILHLINIILVFIFIRKFTENNFISLFTSFFFAIHPLHVESVAWNSERKDVLYTLFFLLSLITYLQYLKSNYKFKFIALTLLFFGLSVLSKSMAITLPLILLIIDFYYNRKIISKKTIIEKSPFLILILIFIVITLNTQKAGILNLSGTYSYFNRVFLISYGLSYYLIQFIFPYNLSAIHPYPEVKGSYLPVEFYLSFLFIIFIIWLILKFRNDRKYLIFGILFFIITILPVLQIVPFGLAIVSERYTYVPYLGLFLIIFTLITQSDFYKKTGKSYLYIVLAAFSIYYSYLVWDRIKVWKNGITLWSDNVSKNPDYFLSYYKLGGAYENDKNYSMQIECYNRCILLSPLFYNAYNDRGFAKCITGNIKGGIEDYNKAISINSEYTEAYNNRGMARDNSGDINGAINDFNKSIIYNPNNYEAYNNRGWVYFNMNKINEAISDYKVAISLNPNFLTAYKNLGWVYYNLKNYNEAIKYYSSAIKISGEDAQSYQFRGLSYLNTNGIDQACQDLQKAKELGRTDSDEYLLKYCK